MIHNSLYGRDYLCIQSYDFCVFGIRNFFFQNQLYCLVGCLSMIVLTHAILGVIYACVLYFCICTHSAQLGLFHMERRSGNTIITGRSFDLALG